VRNAFLAAEDASFYSHKGIDPVSILRAVLKNLESGSARQGGSTITQQVVKNLLLSTERNIQRKIKEAILSYKLEEHLSKDEILEMYLNQIFFGNSAYGIKAAALIYFHKEPSQLSLAEGAMLASLPKAPSRYSPLANVGRAKRRQKYVLDQMVKAHFTTREEADKALNEKVESYRADQNNIYAAPFYVAEVRRIMLESAQWRSYDIDVDGLEIHTALDLTADRMASAALRKGLREVDKRRGWRGPIGTIPGADVKQFIVRYHESVANQLETNTVYPALVTEVTRAKGAINVDLGKFTGTLDAKGLAWARKRLDKSENTSFVKPDDVLKVGDVVEVSIEARDKAPASQPPKLMGGAPEPVAADEVARILFDQTPEIEGSTVLLDPHSGKVLAAIGGYSYQRSQFNRVTQALRQPGSAFKPVIYLSAVDGFGYTPATIVDDKPRAFRVGDEVWAPANFDEKYLGEITLRTALERSRNLVSADIISRIGVDAVIKYARKLGITSKLGHNLSLSLGSSEVTMLEIARAYGVFAAKGVLFDSVFLTKVSSREGKVLYDADADKLSRVQQAINENSAFVMANMMKGVVEHGTGYRVKEIKRPVAGKTGTSNEQMDTWFVGYTPSWVCGVWVGFDQKKEIGKKETGGVVAAPIWLYFMHDYLNDLDTKAYDRLIDEGKAEATRLGIEYTAPEALTPLDFSVPDGVEPFWVDKN